MVDMNRSKVSHSRKSYLDEKGLDPNDSNSWSAKWGHLRDRYKNHETKPCRLSFENYIDLAVIAGITNPDQIGVKRENFQLGRYGDTGPYEIGNCRFITMEQNIFEKILNGGTSRQGDKMRGRTKDTDEGIQRGVKKREGRNAENHEGIRRTTELSKGRPNPGTSEKLLGRNTESHLYIANTARKNSNHYIVVSPDGILYEGVNLTAFCREHNIDQAGMS